MDDLNLPSSLILVWDLRRAIETHQSLHMGIKNFNNRQLKSTFAMQFNHWWQQYRAVHTENDLNSKITVFNGSNIHHSVLIQLIQKGLQGVPIYDHLVDLDQNMINSCDDDIEKHVSLLPLILQIPLLGLLFPAILILLLVPALRLLQL